MTFAPPASARQSRAGAATLDESRGATLLETKAAALDSALVDLPSVIIAYSGGVDSALLAYTATRVLGRRAVCVTADSASYPARHREMAVAVARQFGFNHEIIRTGEMDRPEYRANPANRCYYCKHELYTRLSELARERGVPVIADGSNADDRGDYRPGRQAAREFGVRSPLDAAGLGKDDVRELARRAGLPTWNEPASACLSSRIPYFSEVTEQKLRMIEAAETALRDLGFRICRVRHHETIARIEFGADEIPRAVEPVMAARIDASLREIGYAHVTIDLRGYRLGSLNEALRLRSI